MSWLDITLLVSATFFTSALTSVAGAGGGTILIALMLLFMPPAAAIPAHGVVQLACVFTGLVAPADARRLRPPGGHHGGLRSGTQPRAADLRCRRSEHPHAAVGMADVMSSFIAAPVRYASFLRYQLLSGETRHARGAMA